MEEVSLKAIDDKPVCAATKRTFFPPGTNPAVCTLAPLCSVPNPGCDAPLVREVLRFRAFGARQVGTLNVIGHSPLVEESRTGHFPVRGDQKKGVSPPEHRSRLVVQIWEVTWPLFSVTRSIDQGGYAAVAFGHIPE